MDLPPSDQFKSKAFASAFETAVALWRVGAISDDELREYEKECRIETANAPGTDDTPEWVIVVPGPLRDALKRAARQQGLDPREFVLVAAMAATESRMDASAVQDNRWRDFIKFRGSHPLSAEDAKAMYPRDLPPKDDR